MGNCGGGFPFILPAPTTTPLADIDIVLQYEKMGYALGYRDLDKIRDYIYDAVAGFNRVSKLKPQYY